MDWRGRAVSMIERVPRDGLQSDVCRVNRGTHRAPQIATETFTVRVRSKVYVVVVCTVTAKYRCLKMFTSFVKTLYLFKTRYKWKSKVDMAVALHEFIAEWKGNCLIIVYY